MREDTNKIISRRLTGKYRVSAQGYGFVFFCAFLASSWCPTEVHRNVHIGQSEKNGSVAAAHLMRTERQISFKGRQHSHNYLVRIRIS